MPCSPWSGSPVRTISMRPIFPLWRSRTQRFRWYPADHCSRPRPSPAESANGHLKQRAAEGGGEEARLAERLIRDIEREFQEIMENLHRAKLTALERSEQIARWIELTEAKLKTDSNPN